MRPFQLGHLTTSADWEDVQDHKDFVNSEGYKPFTGDLAEIFDFAAAPPVFCKMSFPSLLHLLLNDPDHANFTGDSVAAREAPVTEIAPFNIDLSSTDDKKSDLEDSVLKLGNFCTDSGSAGVAVGWGMTLIYSFTQRLLNRSSHRGPGP